MAEYPVIPPYPTASTTICMRKKCYLTCLKRIEKNPNDVFAMNCAAAVGGRVNINRFEQNMFGNEAVIEKHTYLSGRDDKEDKESEEAED